MVNFLNKEQEVNIPVGGGIFIPSGIVSLWQAAMLYTFMTQDPLEGEHLKNCMQSTERSGWYSHYFMDQGQAQAAIESMETEYNNVTLIWHFETKKSDVLNFSDEARDKFGDVISYDVRIGTLQSKKYRHEYHMIALPAAVNAMAKNLGYETSGFDLGDLISQNTVFSDNFQFEMVGQPEATDEEDEEYYTNSHMWLRRAQLWASLGEDNPRVFRLKDSGTKFDTTSEQLSNALGIANYPWTQAIYAKVVTVNDPRYDAVIGGDQDRRLSIPAIYAIYETKEDALADVEATLASYGDSAKTTTATSDAPAGSPAVPEAWKDNSDDWKTYFAEFKAANPTLIPPPVGKQVVAKAEAELGVTEEELRAWYQA